MTTLSPTALFTLGCLAFTATSGPAQAWEFSPGTPCRLQHITPDAVIDLTYDPGVPLYTISITRDQAFAPAPVFSMMFEGPMPIAISTDRHVLGNDGKTLTVTDSGFGNVLNGLQFNHVAVAQIGEASIRATLADAAGPVAAFRKCDVLPSA